MWVCFIFDHSICFFLTLIASPAVAEKLWKNWQKAP